jgi:hypothetical protein
MGLGTKNRKKQTADICKQHLREKYREKLGLVEEFILEIEGARKNCDVARWGQFTDIKDIKEAVWRSIHSTQRALNPTENAKRPVEMLRRLDVHFENWLNA